MRQNLEVIRLLCLPMDPAVILHRFRLVSVDLHRHLIARVIN